MYVLMFAAAIKLRYKHPHVKRAFTIPAAKWACGVLRDWGSLALFPPFLWVLPPAQIKTGNTLFYVSFLALSICIVCVTPSVILLFKKRSWSLSKHIPK